MKPVPQADDFYNRADAWALWCRKKELQWKRPFARENWEKTEAEKSAA